MKNYVLLSAYAIGDHSESEYIEELFLPENVWNEIKDSFTPYFYISELDGKHSEVKANIKVEIWSEEELKYRKHSTEPHDDELHEHIYEYLSIDKYDDDYLYRIKSEVLALSVVDEITIQIYSKDKETVMELLKPYLYE